MGNIMGVPQKIKNRFIIGPRNSICGYKSKRIKNGILSNHPHTCVHSSNTHDGGEGKAAQGSTAG